MRILVIEDEHKIAQSLKKGLEQESYAVDLAFDGQTGMDMAIGEEYDLVILDRMLPGMDGMTICKEMRDTGIHTPVIVLTAKGQLDDKVEGLDGGADDYLVKPFAFEELLARIRALKRRPNELIGTVLKVGNLTLDTKNLAVKRGTAALKLSVKEYALLEYLMRHPGKIITKEQIMNHVWSYDSDILPNTVEVYIGYLRSKVDKPFKDKQLIHTVRGFGYRIGEAE